MRRPKCVQNYYIIRGLSWERHQSNNYCERQTSQGHAERLFSTSTGRSEICGATKRNIVFHPYGL